MIKQRFFPVLVFLVWVVTVFLAFFSLFSQGIPFWYDPARDLLTATSNITKLTLIGSPSGIPGIFYGPYWIWLLSFSLLFSKDPRIVTLITTTIPYLILFPFVLFFFARIFGKFSTLLLWLLFFYASQRYIVLLWNPNLAPLLFLSVISLLLFAIKPTKKSLLLLFAGGLLTGFALNIHLSFSIGFTLGCLLFLLLISFLQKNAMRKKLLQLFCSLLSFVIGIGIIFIPFFLFEVRHGFQQTHTALIALGKGGGVVSLQGLTKQQILLQYFGKIAILLNGNFTICLSIISLLVIFVLIQTLRKKIIFTNLEQRLLLLLGSITCCVLGVYLSAKNPVWEYHFIGAEIVFLLFFGILLKKIKPLSYIFFAWVLFLSFQQVQGFMKLIKTNPLQNGTLYTKELIVDTIKQDAQTKPYTVYAYSSSIYTYEYTYLFQWLAHKDVPYDPGQIQRTGDVYLILPRAKQTMLTDFISFRTPITLYKTTKQWKIPDGTIVLKRSPL